MRRDIAGQVGNRCILDGELAVSQFPASFVAYDCLYVGDREIMDRPLWERRKYLEEVVREENSSLAVPRFVEEDGIGLYTLADERELEGVVGFRLAAALFLCVPPAMRTRCGLRRCVWGWCSTCLILKM